MIETRVFEGEAGSFRYARLCVGDFRRVLERVETLGTEPDNAELLNAELEAIHCAIRRADAAAVDRETLESNLAVDEVGRFYLELMTFTGAARAKPGEAKSP